MGSPWKALPDDGGREILLLLKKRDMIPTEIAEHFNSYLNSFVRLNLFRHYFYRWAKY